MVEKGNVEHLLKSEGKQISPKKRRALFLNMNISCIATSMLGTALTTALPPIMEELDMTVNTAQWLTSGFVLFLAVMTPFTAFLISRFRTKRLYCIALVFFILGLTICAFSNSFWMMMLGRIIQGCGNGLIGSMAQVIIITIYPPEKIGTMMGWYGLSIGVAPIIAPTLAGILVDTIGWRMIFIISIAVMAISLICAIFIFEDVLPLMDKKFDVISFVLSALAFGGVTLAVGNMGTYDFMTWQVGFALIVGIITFIIFVWRQLRIDVPFLDVRVLKNWDYTISLISTVLIQLTFMGTSVIVPYYVQQLKHKNATISGLVTLPGSLAWAFISPFAGKFYDKFGMKILYLVGSPVLIISNAALYFISIDDSIWILSGINVLRFIACGALVMPLVTWSMKDVPKLKTSDATALYNSIRFVAGAVASALFISIMTKIAKANPDKKSPEMFGINIVFLIMTFISVLLLLVGIFGCKEKVFKKNTIISKNEKEMTMKKDNADDTIEVVIGDKDKSLDHLSDNGTVIDANNEISIDEISLKDRSDVETVIDSDKSLSREKSEKSKSDIEVVVNNHHN